MEQQADSNNSCFLKEKQDCINTHGRNSMQRVKTNTAAAGLEQWIRQEVVQVNQHRKPKQDCSRFPFCSEKYQRNYQR